MQNYLLDLKQHSLREPTVQFNSGGTEPICAKVKRGVVGRLLSTNDDVLLKVKQLVERKLLSVVTQSFAVNQ